MNGIIEGLPASALVISTDGKRNDPYAYGDRATQHILNELADSVEYHDDCDWSKFPEVGAALKQATHPEVSLCVAISKEHGVWAVGVCGKLQNRKNAAKVALAT